MALKSPYSNAIFTKNAIKDNAKRDKLTHKNKRDLFVFMPASVSSTPLKHSFCLQNGDVPIKEAVGFFRILFGEAVELRGDGFQKQCGLFVELSLCEQMLLKARERGNGCVIEVAKRFYVNAGKFARKIGVHVVIGDHSVNVGQEQNKRKHHTGNKNCHSNGEFFAEYLNEREDENDREQKDHPGGKNAVLCHAVGADIKHHFGERGGNENERKEGNDARENATQNAFFLGRAAHKGLHTDHQKCVKHTNGAQLEKSLACVLRVGQPFGQNVRERGNVVAPLRDEEENVQKKDRGHKRGNQGLWQNLQARGLVGIVLFVGFSGSQIAKQNRKQGNAQNARNNKVSNVFKKLVGRKREDAVKQISELLIIRKQGGYNNGRDHRAHKSYRAPTENGEQAALFAVLLRHEYNKI